MKHGDQKNIANKTGISAGFMCEIFAGKKRPTWKTAKKLAEATHTKPELWLEGSPDEIRAALKNAPQN